MRVIAESTLRQLAARHSRVIGSVEKWIASVSIAAWSNFDDIRKTFNSVDLIHLKSGSTVYVFNINDFRLIVAIHFVPNHPLRGRVYIFEFLTHAEYDRKTWKERY